MRLGKARALARRLLLGVRVDGEIVESGLVSHCWPGRYSSARPGQGNRGMAMQAQRAVSMQALGHAQV